jgi:hypothetical protein
MNRLIRPRYSKGRFVKIKREVVRITSAETKTHTTNSPAENKEESRENIVEKSSK